MEIYIQNMQPLTDEFIDPVVCQIETSPMRVTIFQASTNDAFMLDAVIDYFAGFELTNVRDSYWAKVKVWGVSKNPSESSV